MPDKPDIATLAGRTLGAVLDEVWPRSGDLGFYRNGPFLLEAVGPAPMSKSVRAARAARRAALDALFKPIESGAVVLVDATGKEIPLEVWLSKRWMFKRDKHTTETLVWKDANGRNTEFYNPRFVMPAAVTSQCAETSRRGNQRYDSDEFIARGVALAHAYRNILKAARELAGELNPELGKNAPLAEREARDRKLKSDERRLRARITKASREEAH